MQTTFLDSKDKVIIAALFLLVILASSALPKNFQFLILDGHAGWAGPHYISVANNMNATPEIFRVTKVYSNGELEPYNHHPPLFFILQKLVIDLAESLKQKLIYSYSLASFFWLSGVLSVFSLLRYLRFSYLCSSVPIVGLLMAWYTRQFMFLATFDAASILLSVAMFASILKFEKSTTKSATFGLYAVSTISLLISWYVVFIIFVYGLFSSLKIYKKEGFFSLVKHKTSIYCLTMFAVAVTLAMMMYLSLAEITNKNLDSMFNYIFHTTILLDNRAPHENPQPILFLTQLWSSFALTPLLFLYFGALLLIKTLRKVELLRLLMINQIDLRELCSIFLGGVILFHIISYHWSNIHPFIFFWTMPVLAILFAIILEKFLSLIVVLNSTKFRYLIIISAVGISGFSLALPAKKFDMNVIFSPHRSLFVETFMALSGGQKYVLETIRSASIQKHCPNQGMLDFLASYPNLHFKEVMPQGYQRMVVICEESLTRIINKRTGTEKIFGG